MTPAGLMTWERACGARRIERGDGAVRSPHEAVRHVVHVIVSIP